MRSKMGLSNRLNIFSNRQSAFVLPTVLVLSIVLLTLGLSVFQLTSGIARSLTDQYWERLAAQSKQAGIAYMSSCIDQGVSTGTWPVTITQGTDCRGNSISSPTSVNTNISDVGPSPGKYKTSFAIYKPITGIDGIPKSRVVGKAEVLNTLGATIRTYTSEITIIINGPTRSFLQVSAGLGHTCGLSDGQVYCWGQGSSGQLGNNSTTNSSIPVAVDTSGVLAGKVVSQVSTGNYHSCAVANGQAYCWGNNNTGQLGNGNINNSNVPIAVKADTPTDALYGKTVTQILASSYYSTCALASGQVYCWGQGSSGQLGNNNTTNSRIPVAVDTSGVLAGKTVTQIATGSQHVCAIANGQAYCWGANLFGQLGNASLSKSLVPVAVNIGGVLAGKAVTQIAAGGHTTCVIASGQAFCWGYNYFGQLGNNSTNDSTIPVAVNIAGALAGKAVTQINGGLYHTCVIASGQAFCWGRGDYTGQLGNNSNISSKIPVAVKADETTDVLYGKAITQITAGGGDGIGSHTCVIADGQSYCWGKNGSGQLGNGQTVDSLVPVKSINTF